MSSYNKWILSLLLVFTAMLAAAGVCTGGAEAVSDSEIAVISSPGGITLDLTHPEAAPEGVSFDGNTVTIGTAGIYRLTGSLQGQVIVNTDGPVELILAGVSLQGEECLSIRSNDPVTITLEENTHNILLDGASAPDEHASAVILSEGPMTIGGDGSLSLTARANNAIRAKDDLTVTGGRLYILSENDGLKARGTLSIAGGSITIHSSGDGLEAEAGRVTEGRILLMDGTLTVHSEARALDAENSILISGGEISLASLDDGIRAASVSQTGGTVTLTAEGYTPADDTEESASGDGIDADTFSLSGGWLSITSAGDGIQALTDLSITGGEVYILSGGGGGEASSQGGGFGPPFGWSQSKSSSGPSAKGLKCDGNITVAGGTLGLSTADDGIHCGILCTIEDGTIAIYASDDAIHADDMLLINGGNIDVYDCFEGLEAFAIEIHGGDIDIYSVNDAVNCNGPEGWGGSSSAVSDSVSGYDTSYYWQSGGEVDLIITGDFSNMGDGMDSNGSLYITGGHAAVSAIGTFMENGIDSGFGYFIISGGEVISGGASAMQPTPSSTTDQCVAVIKTGGTYGGTPVTLYDSAGNELWSWTLVNYYSCLILSHPSMTQGNIYTVTYGETSQTLDFTTANSITVGSSGRGGRW